MKIYTFIYARSDSSRLPNKTLLTIAFNARLIDIVFQRASRILHAEPVLLTTDRSIDDQLSFRMMELGYKVFRGHATNLVQRTVAALGYFNADFFIRVNGDSPFVDYKVINTTLDVLVNSKNYIAFMTNLLDRKFPYGVAIELINSNLYQEFSNIAHENELEHVTQHLYRNAKSINALVSITQDRDMSKYKLTIDDSSDLNYIRNLFSKHNMHSTYWEVLGLPRPVIKYDKINTNETQIG